MTAAELVIGLDASTQSAKAVAWTREGEAVAEGRAPIPLSNPAAGSAEQDPRDWWTACRAALRAATAQVDPGRIAGLAVANQRETVALCDAALEPTRPALVWLDERGRDEIGPATAALGAERLHRETGKPPDLTPVIYRLSWLRRHEPEALDRAALILDVHGYLTGRLTGRAVASWTSADPFGVLDIREKRWSGPILDHLGLTPDRFGELAPPGAHVGGATEAAAAETGLQPGTAIYAGGGDGQCAGLGVNAARPGVVYLNLGTAIIAGAWSAEPRVSRFWRTMTSPTGEGYFLEGCQRAGTFFLDWLVELTAGGRGDPAAFERLEAEAARLPVGAEGLTVCPYLTGCMDPHWDPDARAAFSGLAPHHRVGHLYRAALEALTLETARCLAAMREQGLEPRRVVAVGGGAASALWRRMVADASGLPLTRSASLEASALGAGMSAAVGAGWFAGFDEAAAAMSREAEATEPDPAARAAWDRLSARQAAAYRPSSAAAG